jgi:hypothetical protein
MSQSYSQDTDHCILLALLVACSPEAIKTIGILPPPRGHCTEACTAVKMAVSFYGIAAVTRISLDVIGARMSGCGTLYIGNWSRAQRVRVN